LLLLRKNAIITACGKPFLRIAGACIVGDQRRFLVAAEFVQHGVEVVTAKAAVFANRIGGIHVHRLDAVSWACRRLRHDLSWTHRAVARIGSSRDQRTLNVAVSALLLKQRIEQGICCTVHALVEDGHAPISKALRFFILHERVVEQIGWFPLYSIALAFLIA